MLKNTSSKELYQKDESLEIVEFIKKTLNSIDTSNQSKIFTSLKILKSSTIK